MLLFVLFLLLDNFCFFVFSICCIRLLLVVGGGKLGKLLFMLDWVWWSWCRGGGLVFWVGCIICCVSIFFRNDFGDGKWWLGNGKLWLELEGFMKLKGNGFCFIEFEVLVLNVVFCNFRKCRRLFCWKCVLGGSWLIWCCVRVCNDWSVCIWCSVVRVENLCGRGGKFLWWGFNFVGFWNEFFLGWGFFVLKYLLVLELVFGWGNFGVGCVCLFL